MKKLLGCIEPPKLTPQQRLKAYHMASKINAMNIPRGVLAPQHAAVVASAYWGSKGVRLTVGFMEPIQASLRDKIISHMNAWSEYGNISFTWTQISPQVRISRGSGGYWSYLGTDVLAIPRNQQTMNLEGFTTNTPDSEFRRVVRHETGHTLGMPHEHLRRELVARLDRDKVIARYKRTQGWDEATIIAQTLTPIEEKSLLGATPVDANSIMAYHFDGSLTLDGMPINGGTDIDKFDAQCIGNLYPIGMEPPIPPTPVSGSVEVNRIIIPGYKIVPA